MIESTRKTKGRHLPTPEQPALPRLTPASRLFQPTLLRRLLAAYCRHPKPASVLAEDAAHFSPSGIPETTSPSKAQLRFEVVSLFFDRGVPLRGARRAT